MIHPLFKLIATQPHLLADHLEAYAELVAEEVSGAAARFKRGLLLQAVAIVSIGLGGVLVGIALLLWAVTPPANIHAAWALWAVPLAPWLVALCCLAIARAETQHSAFKVVTEQVRADMAMFREASAA